MKTRVISGISFAIIFIGILFGMQTPILPAAVALISGICVYEINNVAKVSLPFMILSVIAGAFIPFNVEYGILDKAGISSLTALTVYIILMLLIMIKCYKSIKFEQVVISVFASVVLPSAISCWIRIENMDIDFAGKYTESHAVYILLFAFFCAWLSDTFAYFSGVLFGKHKMTPVISPKKTWEGAVGGIIMTALFNVALFFVFKYKFFTVPFPDWDWYAVIPVSVLLSVISIFGDLTASVVKRNFGAKDYGWIMPGHGGLMDRFDSVSFVLPAMYAIISIINAF